MKREGARVRKSALSEIIRQCKEKHNVPPHIDIKAGTVRQRLKRKSSKIGPGQKSPMEVIEPYIVSIITQLSNMRIPISTSQGLQLCNSIVATLLAGGFRPQQKQIADTPTAIGV